MSNTQCPIPNAQYTIHNTPMSNIQCQVPNPQYQIPTTQYPMIYNFYLKLLIGSIFCLVLIKMDPQGYFFSLLMENFARLNP